MIKEWEYRVLHFCPGLEPVPDFLAEDWNNPLGKKKLLTTWLKRIVCMWGFVSIYTFLKLELRATLSAFAWLPTHGLDGCFPVTGNKWRSHQNPWGMRGAVLAYSCSPFFNVNSPFILACQFLNLRIHQYKAYHYRLAKADKHFKNRLTNSPTRSLAALQH